MNGRRVRGVTMVEALVAIAIAAIMAAAAAPSFLDSIARTRLEGTVNALSIDLQTTRSEAIRRRTTAALTVAAGGAAYTVAYAPSGGGPDVAVKTVTMPGDVRLAATAPIVFDGLRGITDEQTITGSSSRISAELRLTTNATGRVHLCTPAGGFQGYTPC